MLVKNFLFHRVSPVRDPFWDPMDPTLFERVLDFISRRFQVVGLEQWFLQPGGRDQGKPLATLGFDDGYRDAFQYAVPILKRRRLTASFYVVTDCIDQDRPTWTYELDGWLARSGVPVGEARAMKARVKGMPHRKRLETIDALRVEAGAPPPAKGLMMSWDDVRSLVRDGFTVGSHSKTHGLLATMEDRVAIREELEVSRDVIARETGGTPAAISYPVGSVDSRVIEEAKACGYRIGLATGQKTFDASDGADLFRISRIELYNESWLKTRLRIDGTIETVKRWLSR